MPLAAWLGVCAATVAAWTLNTTLPLGLGPPPPRQFITPLQVVSSVHTKTVEQSIRDASSSFSQKVAHQHPSACCLCWPCCCPACCHIRQRAPSSLLKRLVRHHIAPCPTCQHPATTRYHDQQGWHPHDVRGRIAHPVCRGQAGRRQGGGRRLRLSCPGGKAGARRLARGASTAGWHGWQAGRLLLPGYQCPRPR